jgi:uncharacterized protein YkwD
MLAAGMAACSSAANHPDQAPVPVDILTDAIRTALPPPDAPPPVERTKVLGANVSGQSASKADSEEAARVEDQFFAMTNAARAAVGVDPVSRDPDLEAHARAHVKSMAVRGRIYHSDIVSLLGPWWMIGENVGSGPNAQAIETAYERSPSHYENIKDPLFKYVGVGVVIGPGGRIYTAQDYGI